MAKSMPTVVADRYTRELKREKKRNVPEGERVRKKVGVVEVEKTGEVLVESRKCAQRK